MKESLATFSGLVLAVDLTFPAWAQLGHAGVRGGAMATQQTHIGAGQSAHLSISTTDRASSGAHLNQPGKLGTSAHLADSTKTQVKSTSELASTDKTHVKTQAGSSAHLKDGFEGAVARR